MARVLYSGIQPTGGVHLGNYLGAIRNWVRLQEAGAHCVFSVVDLHALTAAPHTQALQHTMQEHVEELAAAVLASGVREEGSLLYRQSHVPHHSQLQWLLACRTPLPWLHHMTQFKAKAETQQHQQLGLLAYPVLMAADILLFKGEEVPVGDDQQQHLELARRIAQSFNHAAGRKVFPLPQPVYSGLPRVMSLSDGSAKMSKSSGSARSRIELLDPPDAVASKVRRARTDAVAGISYEPDSRPEVANLLRILAALRDSSAEAEAQRCRAMEMRAFKEQLAEALVEELRPVQERMQKLLQDRQHVRDVLARGGQEARERADATLQEVHQCMGLA